MLNYLWFFLAALFEIAGCFAFWMWLRQGKSAWWVMPALLSLTLFALLLTRVEANLRRSRLCSLRWHLHRCFDRLADGGRARFVRWARTGSAWRCA
jgi:hypothetical protein